MGKRSSFERRPQDTYPTPVAAVEPLLPYLRPETHFIEPCAGDGYLVGHLKRAGHILFGAYDLPDDACTKRYRETDDRSPGFFDVDERLAELSAKGDGLERVQALVDFEMFRPGARSRKFGAGADRSKGGRPACPDPVLMSAAVLILQAMHALSDERTEFLIKEDRLSFMRFLGLRLADAVPDANTIWTFREARKRPTLLMACSGALTRQRSVGRLPGDERPDRRRHDCGDAQTARNTIRREEGDQEWPDSLRLEGRQACEARA